MNADTVQRWLEQAAASLHEQRDYLTQLDAAIGDADHGTNMDRGFTAVVAKLGETDGPVPPGKLLTTAGSTLVSTVGGASGPLWGTALRRAGRALVMRSPEFARAMRAIDPTWQPSDATIDPALIAKACSDTSPAGGGR